ncbi:MAG: PDZ domain-containing protein [Alphaproteobacteria bacterium]|nr:PDZ domain-containing protein [Alphaproteobacteria bacterium]OJV11929.1 MAG: hypothetical protein BGO27_00485 [Alphaproteobacteria bacterium 33-17]
MLKKISLILTFISFANLALASNNGYYQDPDVFKNLVVFVSEDDLWVVPKDGGDAKRITTLGSDIKNPVFSPDGKKVVFSSNHNGGYDLYTVDLDTGELTRVTYISSGYLRISDWYEPNTVYFVSDHTSAFNKESHLFKLDLDAKKIEKQSYGGAKFFSTNGRQKALQKIQYREFGYWKSYKGGATGDIWFDNGKGKFNELFKNEANTSRPTIIEGRIFFLSDKDGVGNIYSMDFEGRDIRQHTLHKDYYVRHFRGDNDSLVYSIAGDLYIHDIATDKSKKINIAFHSNKGKSDIKFPNAKNFIEHYSPHPKKDVFVQIIRGHVVVSHYFNGTSFEVGNKKYRYRIAEWAKEGKFIILASSFKESDCIHILDANTLEIKHEFTGFKFGRINAIIPANKADKFVVTNDTGDMFMVTFGKGGNEVSKIDATKYGWISGISWSDDDMHIAYSAMNSNKNAVIKLYSIRNHESSVLTEEDSNAWATRFDSKSKFLYFLSDRNYVPFTDYHDGRIFYPMWNKPYIMSLNRENLMPFYGASGALDVSEGDQEDDKKEAKSIINIKNSHRKIVPFPVPDMLYYNIYSSGDKIWFLMSGPQPNADILTRDSQGGKKTLQMFDFNKNKLVPIADGIEDAILTKNGESFLIRVGAELRLISSMPGGNPSQPQEITSSDYGADSGWVYNDPNLMVNVKDEWYKIYNEAWANQKDRFNNPRHNINWNEIYQKYKPLLEKVSTRLELNDVLWEMQGELKTSHAYVFGGDIKEQNNYTVAKLGATFTYDENEKAYRFERIYRGEPWNSRAASPLKYPGLKLRERDLLYSINNLKLTKEFTPEMALVNAGNDRSIILEVAYNNGQSRRYVHVNSLDKEYDLYYKEFIKTNGSYVAKKTDGKICYIHVPDMMPRGFTEFYKGYLNCYNKDGIIIDARYNGGGYVSSQILDFLTRHRIGVFDSKIMGKEAYPSLASKGNYVLLVNQYSGSDGDIFANAFKFMRLGPVIGKRTWGGTIGIRMDKYLVDGALTTQPEFISWFANTGYDIENYGVDPNIEVENTPNDAIEGKDTQLDRAIEEITKLVMENN